MEKETWRSEIEYGLALVERSVLLTVCAAQTHILVFAGNSARQGALEAARPVVRSNLFCRRGKIRLSRGCAERRVTMALITGYHIPCRTRAERHGRCDNRAHAIHQGIVECAPVGRVIVSPCEYGAAVGIGCDGDIGVAGDCGRIVELNRAGDRTVISIQYGKAYPPAGILPRHHDASAAQLDRVRGIVP